MKTKFFTLVLAAAFATASLPGAAQLPQPAPQGQDVPLAPKPQLTKKEQRALDKAARSYETKKAIEAGFAAGSFSFLATSADPPFGPTVSLTSWYCFFDISPDFLQVQLPYYTSGPYGPVAVYLIFETSMFEVTRNIVDEGLYQFVFETDYDGLRYEFSLSYDDTTGRATLSLKPNLGNRITYRGYIEPDPAE